MVSDIIFRSSPCAFSRRMSDPCAISGERPRGGCDGGGNGGSGDGCRSGRTEKLELGPSDGPPSLAFLHSARRSSIILSRSRSLCSFLSAILTIDLCRCGRGDMRALSDATAVRNASDLEYSLWTSASPASDSGDKPMYGLYPFGIPWNSVSESLAVSALANSVHSSSE